MKRILRISTAALATLLFSTHVWAGRIHPSLEDRLRSLPPGQEMAVIVELTEQANLADVAAKHPDRRGKALRRDVIEALQSEANRGQGRIQSLLAQGRRVGKVERVVTYWIFIGFAATATESAIRLLAASPDVKEVRPDIQIPIPAPSSPGGDEPPASRQWNIDLIRAPEVWSLNTAYQGAGAVVGSFDTGVDLSHPDLSSRYRGNHHTSWFDPYGEHAVPFDANGHGTHTTATAVGGDASGTSIGVAPGATWIAAKGWSDSGIALASVFHQIFQWFLAPGGDPDSAPDVVNNSWTFDEPGCQAEFMSDVEAWRAAGIFPAFASGNEGPGPGTVLSPGAYVPSFTVGATDDLDEVAWFSSEGPSPCDNAVKPDISAPGDSIFSAVPGGYDILSGTSMATPHISGAVAVLRSIRPSMTVEELEFALTAGARDIADPGPDNTSGAGRLDLYASAQIAILGPDAPVVKVVASTATAMEAGTVPGTFTVSRTVKSDADLVVLFSVSGTAVAGSDYQALPESVTIPAGSTEATVQVVPVDDPLVELDESVILTICPDEEYVVSGSDTATVKIVSDELIPDLSVSSLSVPAAAGAGQSIAVSDTTRNRGAGQADSSITRLYLSTNSTLDASDIQIGSRDIPAMASGASSSGATTVTIPPDTPAGSWSIVARADADGTVPETSEDNNTVSRSVLIGSDLVISTMSIPATAAAGQSIPVSDTTKNQGGGTAGASTTSYYFSTNGTLDASDIPIGDRSVPALAAGTTNTGSVTVTVPQDTPAGTWYIIGKADADGTVGEALENNNTNSRSIRIGGDLVISSLSVPAAVAAGQSITLSDTTKNQGGGAAAGSVTRYYLSNNVTLDASDMPIGDRIVPALAADDTNSGSATAIIPQATPTGSWYIVAKADANDTVPETSENNNTHSRSIQIGSDLVISSLSVPAAAAAGQTMMISDTAKNQAGGTTDASVTRYYFSNNLTLDASDILIGARSVPALAAGASNFGSTTVAIPQATSAGTWYIIAKADADGVVSETSESNNTYSRSIQIGSDLVILSLSVPVTGGAGRSLTLSETTENQGGATAGSSVTRYYLSLDSTLSVFDTQIGARNLPALEPGAESPGTTAVIIPQETPTGAWHIIVKADADGAVTEANENNNTYSRSIQIGPDLVVSSLLTPASAGAGQSIALSETTRNQGGGAVDISVTRYYLTSNSTLDASDTFIGSRSVSALAPGAENSWTTTVTLPQGTPTGTWYILAKADADGTAIEVSESNNSRARSIQIGSDLVVSTLSAPGTGGAGQSVTLSDTTKNQGGGAAEASVTGYYWSSNSTLDGSDILVADRSVPALAAGTTSSGQVSVTIPAGTTTGAWYIIAKADMDATVTETSESNNTYSRSMTIGPDLDVSALTAPSTALTGQNITVSDTIKNQGGGPADASVTTYYLSSNNTLDGPDIPIGARSVGQLAAGTSSPGTATVTIPQGAAAGNWYIITKADADGAIAETNENNNTFAKSIRLSNSP